MFKSKVLDAIPPGPVHVLSVAPVLHSDAFCIYNFIHTGARMSQVYMAPCGPPTLHARLPEADTDTCRGFAVLEGCFRLYPPFFVAETLASAH